MILETKKKDKQFNRFLKKEEIQTDAVYTIQSSGRLIDNRFNPSTKQFVLDIQKEGEEEICALGMNKMSQDELAKGLGNDTDYWMNKRIKFSWKNIKVGGREMKVLVANCLPKNDQPETIAFVGEINSTKSFDDL